MVPPRPRRLDVFSVPDTLTVWVGAPATLVFSVGPPSTIRPLRWPIERASITPVLLMTELTTVRADAAVSSTRPPLALSVPSFLTSALSGWPVATSLHRRADRIADRSVISWLP